jgi:hypothetical protein
MYGFSHYNDKVGSHNIPTFFLELWCAACTPRAQAHRTSWPAGLNSDARNTVAWLGTEPLGPDFGGRYSRKWRSDLGCFPHK